MDENKITDINEEEKEKKKRRFPIWARIVSAFLILLLLLGAGGFAFIQAKLSKISRYDGSAVETVKPEDEKFEQDEYVEGVEIIEPEDIDWGAEEGEGSSQHIMSSDGVTNILLIGQDTRSEGIRGRTDAMMILTIDKNQKKLKVTSLMRDMYVRIPGYSDNRINAAYVFGGYDLLKATIETNFGVRIDYFAEVDFFAFKKVVDILGGIYIELNAEEAAVLKSGGHRTVEGMNRLDGEAALAYCRIRYVGNSDYERTQRQRRAISAMYTRLKDEASLPELLQIVDEVLPLVTTNMTNGEIMTQVASVFTMDIAGMEQYRLPLDGAYTSAYIRGMAVLVPDIEKNRQYLWEIIYGNGGN